MLKALPLYALRQNIFTDPQKPMRVEAKVYPLNNPGKILQYYVQLTSR